MVWSYLVLFMLLALVGVVVEILNLYGYRTNPLLFSIHAILLFYCIATLGYGGYLMRLLKRLEDPMQDLASGIRSRITFFRTRYSAWLILSTLAIVALSFAINSYTDNMDGHYHINHPFTFVVVNMGIIVFCYGTIWAAHFSIFKDLRGYLTDLENESSDQTIRIKLFWKNNRWWIITLVILLVVLLGWILIKGIQLNNSFNTSLTQ